MIYINTVLGFHMDYYTDYEEYPNYEKDYSDDSFYKNDGWWASFLLLCIVFGPRTSPGSALPPMRFSDFIIAFMFMWRLWKTRHIFRGFLFSMRVRILSVFMLMLSGVLMFSTVVNTLSGRYPFFIKDYFIPLIFIRNSVIAAIVASFTFGPKQTRQFVKGILFTALLASAFSFIQRFYPHLLSGVVARFYAIEYERLEIATTGTKSRVVGTFGNPNVWGACLVMLGTVSVSCFFQIKGLLKVAALAVFGIVGLAVLLTTGSRTSVIALAAVTVCAALFSFRGRARIWIFFASVLIFFLFLFVRANVDSLPINPRMRDLIRGQQTISQGLADRYGVWQRSLNAVRDSIIIGTGGSQSIYQLSDNGYIMMLLRTGIIGLSIYLCMLAALSFRCIKAFILEKELHNRTIMLVSIMVLICHMLFEVVADFFFSVHYMAVLGFFMGLLCSLSTGASYPVFYEDQYMIPEVETEVY